MADMEYSFAQSTFPAGAIHPILSCLQSIAVDEELFEDEERHFWLVNEEKDLKTDIPHLKSLTEKAGPLKDCVGKNAKVIKHPLEPGTGRCGEHGIGHLLERGPWTLENVKMFRTSLGKRDTSYTELPEMIKLEQDLELAVGGGTGTFNVAFPLYMVLAKRKG